MSTRVIDAVSLNAGYGSLGYYGYYTYGAPFAATFTLGSLTGLQSATLTYTTYDVDTEYGEVDGLFFNGAFVTNLSGGDGATQSWTISVPTSLLTPTTQVSAYNTDSPGGWGFAVNSLSLTLIFADAPPAPTITGFTDDSGTQGDGLTNDDTPTVTGTAAAGALVTILDGVTVLGTTTADATTGAWSVTLALAEGSYTLSATATDTLTGETSDASAALAITVDITPPPAATLALASGDDTGISASDGITHGHGTPGVTVDIVAQVTPGESVRLDAVTDSGAPWFSQTLTAGADGVVRTDLGAGGVVAGLTFGASLTRTDAAGNSSTGPVTWFTLDNLAPTATASVSGAPAAPRLITLAFDEPVFGLSLDDLTLPPVGQYGAITTAADGRSAEFTFTPDAGVQGTLTIGLLAGTVTDAAGNGNAAISFDLAVDTLAPDAPLILALTPDSDAPGDFATRNTGPVTLSGTAEADSTLRLSLDGGPAATITTGPDGAWSIAFAGLADGWHAVSLTATDAAGNTSAATEGAFRLFSRVIEHAAWAGANGETFAGDWGNDTITVVGFGNTILAEGGDDVIRVIGTATIEAGAGDDTIELTGHTGTILAGAGDDTITINAHHVVVDLGTGHDTLTGTNGDYATVTGGPDASVISLYGAGHDITLAGGGHIVSVPFSSGYNTVTIAEGENAVSLTGWGNEVALGDGGNTLAFANGGFNTALIFGGDNTLTAQGIGDAIGIAGGGNTVTIAPNSSWTALAIIGDGNTVAFGSIFGYLAIDGGGNAITTGPNGVYNTYEVTGAGANTLLLRDIASTATLAGDGNRVTLENAHYNTINLDGMGNLIVGSGRADTFQLGAGTSNHLNLTQGFHTITGSGDGLHATLGEGSNTITTGAAATIGIQGVGFNTVSAGAGATLAIQGMGNRLDVAGSAHVTLDGPLTNGAHWNTLTVGDGDAQIFVNGTSNTITAGDGAHSIITQGQFNTIALGEGTATVFARGGFATVSVAGAASASVTVDGLGNRVTTGDAVDALVANAGGVWARMGGGADNVILGAGWASTVELGAGDDTVFTAGNYGDMLTGGAGADRFVVTGTAIPYLRITDFTAGEDRLELAGFAGADFDDLTISQQGASTLVSIGGASLWLDGTVQLSAMDILFG